MGLAELVARYPWPIAAPATPRKFGGWNEPANLEAFERIVLPDSRLIVELGTWLGQSTVEFLRLAPAATVITIDYFQGSPEHQIDPERRADLPTLYEQAVANLYPYRDRCIILRNDIVLGMEEIAAEGLLPDLIYIDGAHNYASVSQDLWTAYNLFPGAILLGDDYNFDTVRAAVADFFGYFPPHNERCWWVIPRTASALDSNKGDRRAQPFSQPA